MDDVHSSILYKNIFVIFFAMWLAWLFGHDFCEKLRINSCQIFVLLFCFVFGEKLDIIYLKNIFKSKIIFLLLEALDLHSPFSHAHLWTIEKTL